MTTKSKNISTPCIYVLAGCQKLRNIYQMVCSCKGRTDTAHGTQKRERTNRGNKMLFFPYSNPLNCRRHSSLVFLDKWIFAWLRRFMQASSLLAKHLLFEIKIAIRNLTLLPCSDVTGRVTHRENKQNERQKCRKCLCGMVLHRIKVYIERFVPTNWILNWKCMHEIIETYFINGMNGVGGQNSHSENCEAHSIW